MISNTIKPTLPGIFPMFYDSGITLLRYSKGCLEERAKDQIIEGYVQGQLCFVSARDEHEYDEWWEIQD